MSVLEAMFMSMDAAQVAGILGGTVLVTGVPIGFAVGFIPYGDEANKKRRLHYWSLAVSVWFVLLLVWIKLNSAVNAVEEARCCAVTDKMEQWISAGTASCCDALRYYRQLESKRIREEK